jgi:site-specific recombinase XerC
MVARIANAAGIARHVSPHPLRHGAITNALDPGGPLRDAQILARHAGPRTTEHYDRARVNLDCTAWTSSPRTGRQVAMNSRPPEPVRYPVSA